jgi:hypothetical protein
MKLYTNYPPRFALHVAERWKIASPSDAMQAAGASHVKSREAQEFLRFVIEDVTPVLTREIVSGS